MKKQKGAGIGRSYENNPAQPGWKFSNSTVGKNLKLQLFAQRCCYSSWYVSL